VSRIGLPPHPQSCTCDSPWYPNPRKPLHTGLRYNPALERFFERSHASVTLRRLRTLGDPSSHAHSANQPGPISALPPCDRSPTSPDDTADTHAPQPVALTFYNSLPCFFFFLFLFFFFCRPPSHGNSSLIITAELPSVTRAAYKGTTSVLDTSTPAFAQSAWLGSSAPIFTNSGCLSLALCNARCCFHVAVPDDKAI
jgi:hypothetical protein